MRVDEFDYTLPEELIADRPAPERTGSRLMVVDRATGEIVWRNNRLEDELAIPAADTGDPVVAAVGEGEQGDGWL